MTLEEKRALLGAYNVKKMRVDSFQREIDYIKRKYKSVPESSKLIRSLEEYKKKTLVACREIELLIDHVASDHERQALTMRYIYCWNVYQIAGAMHFSERQTYHIIRHALEHLEVS